MADQLTGRALDEAAASAVGSYRAECDGEQQDSGDGHWRCSGCREVEGQWHESMPTHSLVRAYSTDPATIPEMLAWLRDIKWSLSVMQFFADGAWHIDADASPPFTEKVWRQTSGRCTTLNEAIARLVVEVARARGAK